MNHNTEGGFEMIIETKELEPCCNVTIDHRIDKLHVSTPLRSAVRHVAGERFWKNNKQQRRFIIAAVSNRLGWNMGIHNMVVTGVKYEDKPRYFWDHVNHRVVIK